MFLCMHNQVYADLQYTNVHTPWIRWQFGNGERIVINEKWRLVENHPGFYFVKTPEHEM